MRTMENGILTDRYKDGFHDGLKRALEILANEFPDLPIIIPASDTDINVLGKEEGETPNREPRPIRTPEDLRPPMSKRDGG